MGIPARNRIKSGGVGRAQLTVIPSAYRSFTVPGMGECCASFTWTGRSGDDTGKVGCLNPATETQLLRLQLLYQPMRSHVADADGIHELVVVDLDILRELVDTFHLLEFLGFIYGGVQVTADGLYVG
jgi:hypothetical protein